MRSYFIVVNMKIGSWKSSHKNTKIAVICHITCDFRRHEEKMISVHKFDHIRFIRWFLLQENIIMQKDVIGKEIIE
jgi:hypothetical protein